MFRRPTRQHSVLSSDAESIRRQEFMARRAINHATDPFMRRLITEQAERQAARNNRLAKRG